MKSLEKNKENILAFLKESGQSKTLGISMMLGVTIKNSLMLAALRELEGEGLIKKDGLNRYTLISKPVSKSKPSEPNSPGLGEAAEKNEVRKTSEETPATDKPEAPVSTVEERIKNTPAPEVAPVVKTPTTAAAEPRKARTLEDVLAKMENRLKAGPVADYENKVTVLTRMAAASEPEIQSILMEIAEDLREVDTRALRHA